MSDTLKKIAENYGAGLVNGSYLNGIAESIGLDISNSTDLMADILNAIGGNSENSTDYLKDIVIAYGGSEPVNGNWMEAWEAITAVPVAPVNTTPPVLDGKYRYEGELVTTDDGSWDNSPTSFTYQWYRDATPISGETLNEYYLDAADVDKYVSCQVTAINGGGSSTPEPSDSFYIFDYDYAPVYYSYEDTGETESILQNQFMLAIKTAGVWDKLDVLCVFRGSGDGAALVDWKRLSEVTNIGCDFVGTQGFKGDPPNSAYIDTGFEPGTMGVNYTLNDASRYFFPYEFGAGPMDGSTGAGSRNRMLLNNSTDHKINQNAATPLSSTFEYTATVQPKSIHRTSATDVTLFNGTTSASRTGLSQGTINNLLILRNNTDYAGHKVAAYAAGASMVAENTAFVAAWNTYITAL